MPALKIDEVLMGGLVRNAVSAISIDDTHRYRVTIQEHNTRTIAQNKKMWAMLSDISKQVVWHGQTLCQEDWKDIFSAALSGQDVICGLDGRLVVLGQRTSKKDKAWHSDLAESMYAFGAEKNVVWSDPAMSEYEFWAGIQ